MEAHTASENNCKKKSIRKIAADEEMAMMLVEIVERLMKEVGLEVYFWSFRDGVALQTDCGACWSCVRKVGVVYHNMMAADERTLMVYFFLFISS